jgi:hypothetical protein
MNLLQAFHLIDLLLVFVSQVAGTGTAGSVDAAYSTSGQVNHVFGLAVHPKGGILVADS